MGCCALAGAQNKNDAMNRDSIFLIINYTLQLQNPPEPPNTPENTERIKLIPL